MGQAIEALLTTLAQALGIEAAKFALGDLFPFLVVTGMAWYGAILFVGLLSNKVLPDREWHEPTPLIEKILVIAIFGGITIGIWGGGLYLFLTGF